MQLGERHQRGFGGGLGAAADAAALVGSDLGQRTVWQWLLVLILLLAVVGALVAGCAGVGQAWDRHVAGGRRRLVRVRGVWPLVVHQRALDVDAEVLEARSQAQRWLLLAGHLWSSWHLRGRWIRVGVVTDTTRVLISACLTLPTRVIVDRVGLGDRGAIRLIVADIHVVRVVSWRYQQSRTLTEDRCGLLRAHKPAGARTWAWRSLRQLVNVGRTKACAIQRTQTVGWT